MFKKFLRLEEILKENNKIENEGSSNSEQQEENSSGEQPEETQQSSEQEESSSGEQSEETQQSSEQEESSSGEQPEETQQSSEQENSSKEQQEETQQSSEQEESSSEEQQEGTQQNSKQENSSEEQQEETQQSSEQKENGSEEQQEGLEQSSEQEENSSEEEQQEKSEQSSEQEESSSEEQQEGSEQSSEQEESSSKEQQEGSEQSSEQEEKSSEEQQEETQQNSEQEESKKDEQIEENKREAEKMFKDISKKSNPDHYNDIRNELEDLNKNEIPDSVINVLINKFFNQQFRSKEDLNKKQDAYQEDIGDLKWNITDIIKHKVTKDLNKIRYDKYGFKKECGKGESIPLSFYFDLSGSMEEYIRILSIMAYKMLENGVKIIVGYNQNAYVQIDKIPNNYTIDKFELLMSNLKYIINDYEIEELIKKEQNDPFMRGAYTNYQNSIQKQKVKNIKVDNGVEIRKLNGIEIDKYLIERKAEKTVIFSDFDPKENVENLSEKAKTWWFCFRETWGRGELKRYKGNFYRTTSIADIIQHLKNIGKASYELKQRRLGEFGTEEYFYGINGAPKNNVYNTHVDEGEKWYGKLYGEERE